MGDSELKSSVTSSLSNSESTTQDTIIQDSQKTFEQGDKNNLSNMGEKESLKRSRSG